MSQIQLIANNLTKTYNYTDFVFKEINFTLLSNDILAITGPNGSGKSTLLKIIAKVLKPTQGTIELIISGRKIDTTEFHNYIFLVAPYIALYEEFSAKQLLKLVSEITSKKLDKYYLNKILEDFNLQDKFQNEIRTYSSGMKQRLKLIIAFLFDYKIILLDEPFTNLDEQGIETLKKYINEFISRNNAIIIATNDKSELALCNTEFNLINKCLVKINKQTDNH